MRLINQYIFKQIVVGYAIVLISLSALIWLTQSLKMIDLVVSQGAGIGAFLEMSLWALPSFVQVISPLAFFAVILFVLTRMQGDKELMVIQAAGISPQQIMKPILVFGVILTIVGYVFSFYLIPHSNQSLREMKFQIRNKISHVLLQEGQFNTLKKGLTIYIRERSDGGLLKDILVYETQKKGVTSSIVAKEGIVYKDIGGLKVQLKDGSRQEWEADKNHFSILKFKDYVMAFNQTVEGEHQQKAKELSSWDLLIVSKKQAGSLSNFRKLKVEIAKRIILPLYHFSFMFLALFGIFSGFYNRRGQTGRVQVVIWWALLFQSMGLLCENF